MYSTRTFVPSRAPGLRWSRVSRRIGWHAKGIHNLRSPSRSTTTKPVVDFSRVVMVSQTVVVFTVTVLSVSVVVTRSMLLRFLYTVVLRRFTCPGSTPLTLLPVISLMRSPTSPRPDSETLSMEHNTDTFFCGTRIFHVSFIPPFDKLCDENNVKTSKF